MRLYSGWANLVIASLAMVATLPGRTQGLGLITEPLIADLHLDRVSYATLNLWATLIGGLFCLPVGAAIDRLGSRRVIWKIAAALGVAVIGMSFVKSASGLAVTLTLTRGLGQSALSVVSLALVGKWFSRRLNFAMGVYSVLVGFGFIAGFPAVGQAVLRFGWRSTWTFVGFALLAFSAVAWTVVRDKPATLDNASANEVQDHGGLTLTEALGTFAFWVFAVSSSMFGLVYSGIALFNQSILEQRGFPATTYHSVLVVSTLLGLCANFVGGWAAQRWSIQRFMSLGMALLAAALLMLPLAQELWQVMLYGVTMGVAGGVVTVVFFSVWGQVYGRLHLGRIQGFAQAMTVLASAIGPLLLAQTFGETGSYESIFYVLAAFVAMLSVACWLVRIPIRSLERAP